MRWILPLRSCRLFNLLHTDGREFGWHTSRYVPRIQCLRKASFLVHAIVILLKILNALIPPYPDGHSNRRCSRVQTPPEEFYRPIPPYPYANPHGTVQVSPPKCCRKPRSLICPLFFRYHNMQPRPSHQSILHFYALLYDSA